jgi:hypothetical protein
MRGAGGAAEQATRSFAFGQLEGGVWGAAWLPPEAPASGVVGLDEDAATGPIRVDGARSDEPWRVEATAGELTLEGIGQPALRDPDAREDFFDQLCRVTGKLTVGGSSKTLDCLGWRGAHPLITPARAPDSFRLAASWFEPEDGFALLALRPRNAEGQDEETVQAVLFGAGGARTVAEPRLSTTYSASGGPTRASVELWMETEPESDHLYPRRALGAARSAPRGWTVGDVGLEAQPFHWFSGGREGPGIYLLGQW